MSKRRVYYRKKSDHQSRVEKFMAFAKQDIPSSPTMPDEKTRELRAKLILEETLETIRDLGFSMAIHNGALHQGLELSKNLIDDIAFNPTGKETLSGIADGCADIIVVTTGTLSACGIADVSIQREVDKNNLAKFGPGHSYREDGKLVKPPGHRPPDLEGVIEKQIRESQAT